jgi:diguanylate cyclase (GGDEF)-like protein/putative nucleotidyltransferase with HDIG domain
VVEEQTRELVREERRIFFKRLAWYRRRVESLETQAVVDDLTGLRNQRALWRELTRRGSASSPASPLAVVMLDFDMFNEVNQRYGHAVGDAVLRRAASVLREASASPRLAFRYGGEEFVMLVPGDEDEGRARAESVRTQISQLNGNLPAVTVSCGVAGFDGPFEPWVALDRSDAALRTAKRAGRNRVVVDGGPEPAGNAYLVEELEHETARRAALALAVATLQVRDQNTAEHSDDVLTLCESVGRRMGFEGTALDRLMAGAQLHDVGKVAVPNEILNKPGPLNRDEWAVIREHTVIGERILRSVPEMAEVATIVRHSHEHWDGSGYPDGLTGEQIPLASRIILCADAFHAIRSDRPYRRGRPASDAFAELRACAGVQLDPAVVAALTEVGDDVRRGGATIAGGLPRNKRLIALLATLVVGSGSAVAAIPEVRDAIRSVFGSAATTTTEPTSTFSYDPETGFSFGPLGDVLSIAPTAVADRAPGEPAVQPRSLAVSRRRATTDRSDARGGGAVTGTDPSGGTGAAGLSDRTKPTSTSGPTRSPGQPGPSGEGPAAPVADTPIEAPSDTTQMPSLGGSGPVEAKDNGRALGKTLPTPRAPAIPPGQIQDGTGRPDSPGRSDPPAIGRETGPASPPNAGGNGKGGSRTP